MTPKKAPPAEMPAGLRNRIVGHEDVAPDQLLANPANFRLHPKAQRRALAGSLETLGWLKSVLVNRTTGHVIDGHARVEDALERGAATVPVTYLELSEEEERLALAVLDPITEMALRDDAAVAALLEGITTAGEGLEALLQAMAKEAGVVRTSGLAPGVDPDTTPEPPAEPVTRPGDVWHLGPHRLMCGDSTNPADVDRLMGGELAALVFTDPPYGISYRDTGAGAWNEEKKAKKRAGILKPRFEAIEGDDLRGDQLYRFLLAAFREMRRVTTPTAAWYVWYAPTQGSTFEAAIGDAGYLIRAPIVWVKSRAPLNWSQYKFRHEGCFYAFRDKQAPAWFGDHSQTTVWEVPSENPGNYIHPTQKPVELARRAIENSSQPGDLVLDPFAGSGSTLIGAQATGRRCFTMEMSPAYCDAIVERYRLVVGLDDVRHEPAEGPAETPEGTAGTEGAPQTDADTVRGGQ